jgi:hypothetical protein
MSQIWKWELEVTDRPQVISMPVGAKIRVVQTQHEVPCIWAEVDPAAPTEDRTFFIVGTGHDFDLDNRQYWGSSQLLNGWFVGHVFEKRN